MDPCYSLLHADTGEENISRHKMEAIVYHILIPMILKQGNHEDDHTPDPRYTLLKLYILHKVPNICGTNIYLKCLL